jgi:hypothetical protein
MSRIHCKLHRDVGLYTFIITLTMLSILADMGNGITASARSATVRRQAMTSSQVRRAGAEQTQKADRYRLQKDGSLLWKVQPDTDLPHTDKIEISGLRSSVVVTYGADAAGNLVLSRHLVWPMLRTIPNNTHASLQLGFDAGNSPHLEADGVAQQERLVSVRHRGLLELVTRTPAGLEVTRRLFASRTLPAAIEHITVVNRGNRSLRVYFAPRDWHTVTEADKGVYGAYRLEAKAVGPETLELASGETATVGVVYSGRRVDEPAVEADVAAELRAREAYVAHLWQTLVLQTPDPVQNAMFAFAKIRAAESIYATRGGLMHGPGGTAYYAAIWANDQAEYANPFFAYLGDENGVESALNAYRHFARFMNPDYRPIPSSIIAEGTDTWHGAGDRGDMAMIAYGAARYALTRGDRQAAEELWPLITWCLEYLRRQTGPDGVIHSDSDELEGRFPHGKYNLNTSSLAYDALVSAAFLARDLGQAGEEEYTERAHKLRAAIEAFFGAELYGFHTYRYYEGNATLRAWICTPLCMGIDDRAAGTLDALLSPHLWTPDGVRSEMGSQTFWDRATLYAMRGALAAGAQDRVLPYLAAYSRRRLLGDHVPYAIEAWPEGDQRHLSAESALYGRIYVEGLLGFRPTGLRSFRLKPHLPTAWNRVVLRQMHVCGTVCDIEVSRTRGQVRVRVPGKEFVHSAAPDGSQEFRRQ